MDHKQEYLSDFKTGDDTYDEYQHILDDEVSARDLAGYKAVDGVPRAAAQAYNFDLPTSSKLGFGEDTGVFSKTGRTGAAKPSPGLKKMLDLHNVRSKPIAIPHLQEMAIKERVTPFNKAQVIILTKLKDASEGDQEKHIRETYGISYGILQEMSPALTFQPDMKHLKCKGSFTHDFCTCGFETQVWRVEGTNYILEFRRRSVSGRDAFEYLIRHMGVELKAKGRAEKYGNNIDIYPFPMIPDDLGDLGMPSFGGVGSYTGMTPLNDERGFPISLDSEDQIQNWSNIVMERNWPSCKETLRLCARSCLSSDNRKALAEHSEFQQAVISELMNNEDATSCHNALTIIIAVLEETEGNCLVENELLSAVARALLAYSGVRQQGKAKTIRSVALERAALKVLVLLSENMGQYDQKQVNVVLDVLEGDLGGKLTDEVNQVQLDYVIRNLKKQ